MALPKGRPTWLLSSHSLSQEKGTRGEDFKTDYLSLNSVCTDYTGNETKLANKIFEMDKTCFIILPTATSWKGSILHHYMIDESDESGKIIMGVHGTKFTSPWKAFKAGKVVRALQPPTPTQSAIISPPSLEQF
jgi:hypothetical protein